MTILTQKQTKKSGFLLLNSNWQLMTMVFDPNFGKNMIDWCIRDKRNVASLRQTPFFTLTQTQAKKWIIYTKTPLAANGNGF